MSDWNPTYNYVYQKGAGIDVVGQKDPTIYAVGGPDVPFPTPFNLEFITKENAERLADELNKKNGRSKP